jgi:hypothetical protein
MACRPVSIGVTRPYASVVLRPALSRTPVVFASRSSREGSRFLGLQLYRLAEGGSRERLHVMQFYGVRVEWMTSPVRSTPQKPKRWAKMLRWVIRGSRLLPTDRAAI